MKNSLIRKTLLLISGIMITSILFFITISLMYDTFYKETMIKDNSKIASNWTSSIDNRLNTLYEHLYDLSTGIYRNTDVYPGSMEMDFVIRSKTMEMINSKVMTSSDITTIFVIDTESDMYLFSKNGIVMSEEGNFLKMFVRGYAIENNYSINNKKWSIISVLDKEYYYNALRLGKYIIGAMSDFNLYSIRSDADDVNSYISDGEKIYSVNSDDSLISYIDTDKKEGYYVNGYAVVPNIQESANATTYLLTKTEGMSKVWNMASIFLIVDSALCVLFAFVLIYNTNTMIKTPIRKLVSANQELASGDFEYRLNTEEAGSQEFEQLYQSFNEMSGKIKDLTIEQYDSEIRRQQNQLKMLRAQVKPHTFLNAINTINNMTYTGKPEDIRKYIAAFASFTRYMLYKAKDWTTVEDEIKNIDSYAKMQQIRFPESIEIIYDVPAELLPEKIPYLILFSLVQNSFKHAMTLIDKTYITISGEYYEEENFKGFRLIEEDNGPGFSEEALEKITSAEADDPFTKEHLGLTNVRYSLNLIYKRDDLLRISNREEGGAHIELLIPEMENDDEITGM
ncbi:MAG: histidine kinase [Erysipelotrichaceae bacterium]|nr:histidine kinase [Erysipelotrichaceae bacterium]